MFRCLSLYVVTVQPSISTGMMITLIKLNSSDVAVVVAVAVVTIGEVSVVVLVIVEIGYEQD
jgi:hypothetical protein